ncbi:MAG: hypothetical protein HGA36_03495 [Candidatus Moranbacteria bacterium]|nr:hypothetical protein [Candidatus Moranbacteria bacterium]
MNRKKIEMLLGSLTMVVAFFSWLSVKSAIVVPDSSTWMVPMVLFSLYAVLICSDVILFRSVLALELVLIGSLLLSAVFAFHWIQFVAILLGAYFIFLSSRKIREDMDLNVKISIWKSLQVGKTYLLIALSLVIAAQYFFVMNSFDGEKKVPHFDVSFITKKVAIPFVSAINPQFAVLKDETLTVDQFILQSQQNALENVGMSEENEKILDENIPTNLTPLQKEDLKKQAIENFTGAQTQLLQKNQELILKNGRKQFSDQVGVTLTGSEKISDVFTGLVSSKIDDYFNPKVSGGEKSSVFPMILAAVLLLTIYPLGSILSIAWFLIVKLVIIALLKFKVMSVGVMTVSKETLE